MVWSVVCVFGVVCVCVECGVCGVCGVYSVWIVVCGGVWCVVCIVVIVRRDSVEIRTWWEQHCAAHRCKSEHGNIGTHGKRGNFLQGSYTH